MDIAQIIRQFIEENFIFGDGSELAEDASLLEEGIVDSTGMLDLVAFLEERFAFRAKDEELVPENLDTIRNATEFVQRKLEG